MSEKFREDLLKEAKSKLESTPSWEHYIIKDLIDGKEQKILRCDKYSDYPQTTRIYDKETIEELINGFIDVAVGLHKKAIEKLGYEIGLLNETLRQKEILIEDYKMVLDEQKNKLRELTTKLTAICDLNPQQYRRYVQITEKGRNWLQSISKLIKEIEPILECEQK